MRNNRQFFALLLSLLLVLGPLLSGIGEGNNSSKIEPDGSSIHPAAAKNQAQKVNLKRGQISRTTEGEQGLRNTYYIWSHDGKLMSEYGHDGKCTRNFIYFGNRLIAEYYPQTGKYYYHTQDQVNSTRVVTDDAGDVVYSAVYGPYGDIQKETIDNYEPIQKYSGKERETYSELDYFGGRYYHSPSYRFISVDPVMNKDAAIVNPQQWNLYAYCGNNPITNIDPDGREMGHVLIDAQEDYYLAHYAGNAFAAKNARIRKQTRTKISKAILALLITHGIALPGSSSENSGNNDDSMEAAEKLFKEPNKSPGKNWEKRGEKGNWYNKETGESLRPDLDHSEPVGPHIDYKDKDGKWWRIDQKGNVQEKKKK